MLSFLRGTSQDSEQRTMAAKKDEKKTGKPIPGNSNWGLITGVIERDLVNPLNSVRSAHALYGDVFW